MKIHIGLSQLLRNSIPPLVVVAVLMGGSSAHGFISPLGGILAEMVELRSASPAELVWRHRVTSVSGEVTELNESIFCDRAGISIHWRFGRETVAAQLTAKGYVIPASGKTIPVRSLAYTKTMCATTSEEIRETLLQERFIRKDQLSQFRPTYQPSGDPNLWDTKASYILHDDIFLKRLRSGISVAVVGIDSDAGRRAVYFDRSSSSIARIEWRNGNDILAWNFEKFAATEGRGLFPRKASFEAIGAERVSSDLVFSRSFSEKAVAAFRSERQRVASVPVTDDQTAVLNVLLGYR